MMSAPPESLRLGVLILGAGASRRMGRPKLTLPWGGISVIGHLLGQWREAGAAQTVIVCTKDNAPLHAELDRLAFRPEWRVINPVPEDGMFGSVRAGAAWTGWDPEVSHVAISLGDQPLLATDTLRSLVAFAARHAGFICQPRRAGRARHPVILPRSFFETIAQAPDADFRAFLERQRIARRYLDRDDPGLDLDLDTPEDYQRARVLAERGWEPAFGSSSRITSNLAPP